MDQQEQGKTLRAIRIAAGKTQEQAGAALGITKQAYSRKESGYRPLDQREIVILAEVFGVSDVEILRAERVPESVTE